MKKKLRMSIIIGVVVTAVLTSLPWIQATYFPYRDKPGMPNIPLLTPLVPGLMVWKVASGYVPSKTALVAMALVVNSFVYSLVIFLVFLIANSIAVLRTPAVLKS
jgi:hypothetical protein